MTALAWQSPSSTGLRQWISNEGHFLREQNDGSLVSQIVTDDWPRNPAIMYENEGLGRWDTEMPTPVDCLPYVRGL